MRPPLGELQTAEGIRHLKPRALEVLLDLARHAGEVRSRSQLLDSVWANQQVGEEMLTHCIWELRQALGDDPKHPTYIQTVHRRGYRLIAPVSWLAPKPGRNERYRVGEIIGTGASGVIHQAEDTLLQRSVALKFLPPDAGQSAQAKERFLNEARTAASLDHPNVCSIHEVSETHDGRMFLVMPLLRGETLKQRLGRGPFEARSLARLATQIADGLAAAHAGGIVHRDVKPSNLFLGEDGQAIVLDFGIATLVDTTLGPLVGTSQGTPAYMAPEVLCGGVGDERSDLWSLGVVLYESLSGRRPFLGADDQQISHAVLHHRPDPLTTDGSRAQHDLVVLINELLSRDPRERPSSADQVAERLRGIGQSAESLGSARGDGRDPAWPRGDALLWTLCERVENAWIEPVLKPALSAGGDLLVTLEDRVALVDSTWNALQACDRESADTALDASLPCDGDALLDALSDRDRSLLIAGAAGAGKTVALLSMARAALERCRRDPSQPVPVVLNLAAWGRRGGRLDDWVSQEMATHYFVARELVRGWIGKEYLLILLDGLDEVGRAHALDCAREINRFRHRYPTTALVVTARSDLVKDLAQRGVRLELEGALELRPLSLAQARTALEEFTEGEQGIPANVARLARTPLFVALLRSTLAHSRMRAVAGDGPAAVERRVLADYVRKSLRRREGGEQVAEREALGWLSRLAATMTSFDRSVLQIEQLQPSWLQGTYSRWAYVLISRLAVGSLLGLATGCAAAVQLAGSAILMGLAGGFGAGAGAAIVDGVAIAISGDRRRWSVAVRAVHVALSFVAGFVCIRLMFAITGGVPPPAMSMVVPLALACVLRRDSRGLSLHEDVRAVEALTWSWRSAMRRLPLLGLLTGGVNLVGAWLVGGLRDDMVVAALASALTLMIAFLPLAGLRRGTLLQKTRPNHGMWLSGRSALLGASLTFLSTVTVLFVASRFTLGLFAERPMMTLSGVGQGPSTVWLLGLLFSAVALMWFGAVDLVKHLVLRVLLTRERFAPWRYARFLDYCTRAGVLRRVGGGYLFVHRSIQSLLASPRG